MIKLPKFIGSRATILTVACAALGLSACASKDKARDIETNLEKSQRVQGENLGVKDGNVVVQRKVMLSEELRKLQREVFEKEYRLYGNPQGSKGLRDQLKDCYQRLADPRIGGNGKLKDVQREDRLTKNETEFKFGIDENKQLVSISEEGLSSRIARFKSYNNAYDERLHEMGGDIEVCENEYRVALINNGLNPADTKAKGEWTYKNGQRVWRAKKTVSDDPEELARRKAEKEKSR